MTRTVTITITTCKKCPNIKMDRVYTSDSFENVTGWYCKGLNNRLIAELDWNDKDPPIPKWCPWVYPNK